MKDSGPIPDDTFERRNEYCSEVRAAWPSPAWQHDQCEVHLSCAPPGRCGPPGSSWPWSRRLPAAPTPKPRRSLGRRQPDAPFRDGSIRPHFRPLAAPVRCGSPRTANAAGPCAATPPGWLSHPMPVGREKGPCLSQLGQMESRRRVPPLSASTINDCRFRKRAARAASRSRQPRTVSGAKAGNGR